jgi:hypothetical protein
MNHAKSKIGIPLAIVLLLASMGTACKKNTNVNQPQTPLQRIAVYNTLLAEANNGIAKAVIAVAKADMITSRDAVMVLEYNQRVATASQALTAILRSPGDWATIAPQIYAIASQITPPKDLLTWAQSNPKLSAVLSAMNSVAGTLTVILQEASKK